MLKKAGILLLPVLFILFSLPPAANANILDTVVDKTKDFFGLNKTPKEVTLDSSIGFAPNGDLNKNGIIEAGETVRFTYTLKNTTDKEYSLGTLQTNVNRKLINFIHNVKGATSLNEKGSTITFPNLRLYTSLEPLTISFDARVNENEKTDTILSTEPEFIQSDKQSLVKAAKKEVKAQKAKSNQEKSLLKVNKN